MLPSGTLQRTRLAAPPSRQASGVPWTPTGTPAPAARILPWLLLLYCGASLLHFVHNAAYVTAYPNLPEWISPASICFAWCGISAIGLCGYLLVRRGFGLPGLAVLAVYTTLGLDGLLHYGRAPMSVHTFGMNLTIWAEALTAALALGVVLWIAGTHLAERARKKAERA